VLQLDQVAAVALAEDLADRPARVASREAKPYRRRPAAPFITSTYQQEASRKLRLSSAQAMRVAQGLYERGFITYMRTDSTTLSDTALAAARNQIAERYGSEFLPDAPRTYQRKVKNAQEAHEAIRPAGDRFRTPEEVAGELNKQDLRVYELIWQRTVASQMTDAAGETVTLRLGVESRSGRHGLFSTSGTVITHQGFLKVYVESRDEGDEGDEGDDAAEKRLPALQEGDSAHLSAVEPAGHDTQPPPRYTEASLVKRLEELEVGRPSTYASIMATIQNRGYAWKKGNALVPSFLAFAVVTLLEQHFPDLVDYAFTAQMENDLDSIARGSEDAVPWLSQFYFGAEDDPGLRDKVNDRLGDIDARAINSIAIGEDSAGVPIVARVGQYGPYLQRGDETKSIPDDIPPDELTAARAEQILSVPDQIVLGEHPETGMPVVVKDGKFGPYVQMGGFDERNDDRPKTSSLFQGMDMTTLTLDEAVELLKIPRMIGTDPGNGLAIVARNGPHGPYIERGAKGDEHHDTRSFDDEADLLTMDLPRALALFAEPKRRRGQRAAGPLKRLGVDPVTDREVVVRSGRFGEYVTDGEVNASLQQGDSVDRIDIMRASELLMIRRQKLELEPPKKQATKRAKRAPRGAGRKATVKKGARKASGAARKASKSASARRSKPGPGAAAS
jgi:DNA topoisomerase-1